MSDTNVARPSAIEHAERSPAKPQDAGTLQKDSNDAGMGKARADASAKASKVLQSEGKLGGLSIVPAKYDLMPAVKPEAAKAENARPSSAEPTSLAKGEHPNTGPKSATDSSSSPAKKEWTLAIELTANGPASGRLNGAGAETKLDVLSKLAKQTEGKSVNFVVGVERNVDAKGNLCHMPGKTENERVKCDDNSQKTKDEQYFIHDGKVDKLQVRPGNGNEIADLLKKADEISPSKKLGLVIQSVGLGADGLKTNNGPVSVKQVVKQIESGLKGSAHSSLDVLNFDGCSMAEPKVLSQIGSVAQNVVAASAIEKITKTDDGQNYQALTKSLLDNPAQSGKEFAASIVDQAGRGEDGKGADNSIPTLAAFDMSKYGAFDHSLGQFGADLRRGMSNPEVAAAIRKSVNAAPTAPTGDPEELLHQRDMKVFAEQILQNVGDKDPELKASSTNFLNTLNQMAYDQYGDKNQGQDGVGGLAANIPGNEILDKHEVGRLTSPLHKAAANLAEIAGPGSIDKNLVVSDLQKMVKGVSHSSGRNAPELKQLSDGIREIADAKSSEEVHAAISKMQNLIQEQEPTGVGQKIAKTAEKSYSLLWAEHLMQPAPALNPQWDSFIKILNHPIK